MRLLQTIGWLACAIYSTIPSFWLIIHTRAEQWRSRQSSPYRTLIPLWIVMWAIAAVITAPWRHLRLYDERAAWIPAAALFVTGLWLYKKSGTGFSAKQLGGLPELRPNHPETRLVTTGIRGRIRHPVYLGHLCEMLAWSVGTGLAVCFGLTAIAVLTGHLMITMEDAELEKRFGAEFLDYQKRVPPLLPSTKKVKSRLLLVNGVVRHTVSDRLTWEVRVSEIACIAEYTTSEGPYLDDYYLVFVTLTGRYYMASFYCEGCDEIVKSLSSRWGVNLQFRLANRTDFASRIVWPSELEDEELFVNKTVNPAVLQRASGHLDDPSSGHRSSRAEPPPL